MASWLGSKVARAFVVDRRNKVYTGEVLEHEDSDNKWRVRFSDGDEMLFDEAELELGVEYYKRLPDDFEEGSVLKPRPKEHLRELPDLSTRDTRGRKRDTMKKYRVSTDYANDSPCPYCGTVLGTQKGAAYHIKNKVCLKLKERKETKKRLRDEKEEKRRQKQVDKQVERQERNERRRQRLEKSRAEAKASSAARRKPKKRKADRIRELKAKLAAETKEDEANLVGI
eukprot:scaffold480_cov257-Pinguiococcus_pyrenoidosus.AAC.30